MSSILGQGKRIICYGAGLWGRQIALYLEAKEVPLDGFVVTRLDKTSPNEFCGKRLYEIDEICSNPDFYFLIAVKKSEEIVGELRNRNIKQYLIINDEMHDSIIKELTSFARLDKSTVLNGSAMFIYYHRIGEAYKGKRAINVSTSNFEQHIKYLSEHYQIRRFDEELNEGDKNVIVGFDDGYADVYENAFPILEKYKVPATVFVATHVFGTGEFWNDRLERLYLTEKTNVNSLNDYYQIHQMIRKCFSVSDIEKWIDINERLLHIEKKDSANRTLNDDEILELSKSSLITIGGHTDGHYDLSNVSYDEQVRIIKENKLRIEQIINKPITTFSYPFGGVGENSALILKELGFTKARCSTLGIYNNSTEQMMIPGNSVPDISGKEFAKWLNEKWMSKVR